MKVSSLFAVVLLCGMVSLPSSVSGADSGFIPLLENIRRTPAEDAGALVRKLEHSSPADKDELVALFNLLDDFCGDEKTAVVCDAASESVKGVSKPDASMKELLLVRLRSGRFASRRAALSLELRLRNRAAVPSLLDMLNELLAKPGESSQALSDEQAARREEETAELFSLALDALSAMDDERAVPALAGLMGKTEEGVGQTLAKFGHRALAQVFEVAMHSADQKARAEAWACIGKMGDRLIVPDLWRMVKADGDNPRREVLSALIKSCDGETSPSLDGLAAYLRDIYARDKSALPLMLELAGRRRDSLSLIALLGDKTLMSNTRISIIRYAGALPREVAVPVLEYGAKDADEAVRRAAADTLKLLTRK